MENQDSPKIRVTAKFTHFIEQTISDEKMLERVAQEPIAVMRESGLLEKDLPVTFAELQSFCKALILLHKAAQEDFKTISYVDVFNALFGKATGRRSIVADEKQDCHTGYNRGWGQDRIATRNCGTHRVFPYDISRGPLLKPGEAVALQIELQKIFDKIIGPHR